MPRTPIAVCAALLVWAAGSAARAFGSDSDVDRLVSQLRSLATPSPGTIGAAEPAEESTRRRIGAALRDEGDRSVPTLARALGDRDLNMRRNVTWVLGVLGGDGSHLDKDSHPIDISAALPALVKALHDPDELVRTWAAQDIGDIGLDAGSAVPALIELMHEDPKATDSVCMALHDIGPVAIRALPDVEPLLSDSDPGIRKMAQWAVSGIEGQRTLPQE